MAGPSRRGAGGALRGAATGLAGVSMLAGVALLRPAHAYAQVATVAAPRVVRDPIPYPPARRREMEAYSARHYGVASSRLVPRVIVLHYTWGPTYASARATFAHDRAHRGELPGVCAHYVVEQDGTTYEVVDPGVRCRHVVGLNHVALGIEMVQPPAPRGTRQRGRWAVAQIFARPAQIAAALALTRALQTRYRIATRDVIGHAMANRHRLFEDRVGARNTHSDWDEASVAEFRRRLGR